MDKIKYWIDAWMEFKMFSAHGIIGPRYAWCSSEDNIKFSLRISDSKYVKKKI